MQQPKWGGKHAMPAVGGQARVWSAPVCLVAGFVAWRSLQGHIRMPTLLLLSVLVLLLLLPDNPHLVTKEQQRLNQSDRTWDEQLWLVTIVGRVTGLVIYDARHNIRTGQHHMNFFCTLFMRAFKHWIRCVFQKTKLPLNKQNLTKWVKKRTASHPFYYYYMLQRKQTQAITSSSRVAYASRINRKDICDTV